MKRLVFALLLLSSGLSLAQDQEAAPAGADVPDQQALTNERSVTELQLLVTPLTLEQLAAEAERWQSRVQSSMSRIASLKVSALSATGDSLGQIHEQINRESEARFELTDKFEVILDSMELKGGDQEVIDGYRNYLSGALASELQATDIRTMLSEVVDWTTSTDGGIGFLAMSAIVLGSLFLLLIIARFMRALARRGLQRISNLSHLMQDFLAKVVFWLVFVIGLMVELALFGVNIAPLFAVVGGASFILAFAMQDTLGNLASGLMIMINKPFDVGDLVDTNGVLGVVEAVSIVSTTVRTLDNQVVILPNSSVWGSIITNVTVSPTRRVDMVFGIGYSDDIETAQQVLEKLVTDHPLILDDPKPTIAVHELADSSVNFVCRPWTRTEDYWTVYWDLTRQVKEGFDEASVSIPFPQRDVHLYSESA